MTPWVVSVKGVILWDDAVVLVHNERDEWELPGGQLEDGETPEQCVAREIEEELSLVATPERLLDVWVYEVLPGKKVLIVTFGCSASRPAELVHSGEHDGVCLAPVSDLDSLPMPEGYRASVRAWSEHLASEVPTEGEVV
jgi:8-oxo-dGTP pyrophosphatase MutT (NUDIX family)